MISWAKPCSPGLVSFQTDLSLKLEEALDKKMQSQGCQLPFNHIFLLKLTPHSSCVTDGFWHSCQHTAGMTAGSLQDIFPFSSAPRVWDRWVCNTAVTESCTKRQACVQAAGFDLSVPPQRAQFCECSTYESWADGKFYYLNLSYISLSP